MKKILSIILSLCMMFALAACGTSAQDESDTAQSLVPTELTETDETKEASVDATISDGTSEDVSDSGEENSDSMEGDSSRVLIAYFSRADENYGVGVIEKGNTEIIAEMIAEETGGDLFHIERSVPYPAEYDECTEEAKKEQEENARPELASELESIEDYNTIFIGYPIWWSDMPMAVYTFLESYDFSGKTVVPFCTHAGSGLSSTVSSIKDTCPDATLLEGFAIQGSTAQNDPSGANEAVMEWLEKCGFIE